MRRISMCITLAFVALVAAPAVVAQETAGGIAGVARDTAGAVLPGALVEAVGPAGKVTTVTDERGEYRFPRLPSGRYTVTASLQGFTSSTTQSEVVVGSVITIFIQLKI